MKVNKLRNGVKMIVDQVVNTVSHLYLTQKEMEKIGKLSTNG